jgi:[ribosomal protein S5]-alanine N-acetyltransferase
MSDPSLRTPRLELSPLSADSIEALLQGNAEQLRSLTGAKFSHPVAPPPYMAESLPVVLGRLRSHPEESEWWSWIVLQRDSREALGAIALGGKPDATGAVLVGYAMYPGSEGRGYATEAVRAIVDWVFAQEGVRRVRALAPVWNTPAVHVAEKVGMRPVASNEDDEVGEVLVYETSRTI